MNNFNDTTFGIIGYGSFGALLAQILPKESQILVSSRTQKSFDQPNVGPASLEQLKTEADVLFLSIPLEAYSSILPKIDGTKALIVDVASVKVAPTELLRQHLQQSDQLLITHPLFGPQTAQHGLDGLKFIVTQKSGDKAEGVVEYFESLGLEIVYMSADDHDKQMAYTHVLTFFISRALLKMNIRDVELSAPSFQKLLALEDLESKHSEDLFRTIQKGNPYGKEVRETLLKTLQDLQTELDG